MLTENDLRELLDYKGKNPVLSVYLNIEPSEGSTETHKLRLRSMLKEAEMPKDAQVIERYFDHEFDWIGRSVAVFSCAPEAWFRVYSLAIPIRSRLRIGNRPHVKPLVDILDAFGGYGVALVDKQGARLFHFHLGKLIEQEGVLGESVRRTKRGGGSQAAGRRGGVAGQTNYVDEVAERNAREAAEFAARFFSEKNVRRIVIGGTEDNIGYFRSQLPKAWQSLVIGTFSMSMTASHDEILDRAMQIGLEAELRREAKLIEMVITSAAKGRGGVVRLEDTLKAVQEGRVQTLLIREGLRIPGQHCPHCGYVTSTPMQACPACGHIVEQTPDLVEMAVKQTLKSGGDVEILHNDLELADYEHIGGLLRY
ncbi:MAG: host attachment protein [Anaerolineales bacterium]|nr:host attachment protein [Anaerolineales bacterium]